MTYQARTASSLLHPTPGLGQGLTGAMGPKGSQWKGTLPLYPGKGPSANKGLLPWGLVNVAALCCRKGGFHIRWVGHTAAHVRLHSRLSGVIASFLLDSKQQATKFLCSLNVF
jgi:hypothetical protein